MSKYGVWIWPAAAAFLLYSTAVAIQAREDTRRLTAGLADLRAETRRLEDEWRSLNLEYVTFAEHSRVYSTARKELGMVEPSLKDGNLLYLERDNE